MKRVVAAFLLILALAAPAPADLKIVGETKVGAHRMVRLTADGAPAGAGLIWDVYDEDRADVEEVGKRLLFVAPPGVYKVKLRSVVFKDGQTVIETARAVVTVGDAPTPPPPTDPLAKTLQDAYNADPDPNKGTNMATLSGLVGNVVAKARSLKNPDGTPTLTTLANVQSYVHATTDLVVGSVSLPMVRKAGSNYVATKVPAQDQKMTDELWSKLDAAYADVARALKGVK